MLKIISQTYVSTVNKNYTSLLMVPFINLFLFNRGEKQLTNNEVNREAYHIILCCSGLNIIAVFEQ